MNLEAYHDFMVYFQTHKIFETQNITPQSYGSRLFCYLDNKYNKVIKEINEVVDKSIYVELKEILSHNKLMTIKDGERFYTVVLDEEFGRGGSKIAYKLNDKEAILLPNVNPCDPTRRYGGDWKYVVASEMAAAKAISGCGLLTPHLREIAVVFSKFPEIKLHVYLCQSFENLAKTQHIYICACKVDGAATWKFDKDFVFDSRIACETRFEVWDAMMESLTKDLALVNVYSIPLGGDSSCLAIIKKPEALYPQLRYFGFDFGGYTTKTPDFIIDEERIARSFRVILGSFLCNEFRAGVLDHSQTFLNTIIERYTPAVIAHIEQINSDSLPQLA